MRNLENATPEGVTDIQPVLVAAPFGPHLSLEPNRGRQVSGHTSQDTYLMLAEWLNLSDALVIFKCFTDAHCTVTVGYRTVPYNLPLMYRTFRYYI
jgi:hypothetical protein